MARTANIYMYSLVTGSNAQLNYGSLTTVVTSYSAPASSYTLQSIGTGMNTVVASVSCYYVDIIPPSNSINGKFIMFGGDTTGVQINPSLPSRLSLGQTQTYFIIRAPSTPSGPEIIELYWY